jgi:hypothetical protein
VTSEEASHRTANTAAECSAESSSKPGPCIGSNVLRSSVTTNVGHVLSQLCTFATSPVGKVLSCIPPCLADSFIGSFSGSWSPVLRLSKCGVTFSRSELKRCFAAPKEASAPFAHPMKSVRSRARKSQTSDNLASVASKESRLLLLSNRTTFLSSLARLDPIGTTNRAFLAFYGFRNLF